MGKYCPNMANVLEGCRKQIVVKKQNLIN